MLIISPRSRHIGSPSTNISYEYELTLARSDHDNTRTTYLAIGITSIQIDIQQYLWINSFRKNLKCTTSTIMKKRYIIKMRMPLRDQVVGIVCIIIVPIQTETAYQLT